MTDDSADEVNKEPDDRPGEIPPDSPDTLCFCGTCGKYLDEQLVLECPKCGERTVIQRLDAQRKLILVREGEHGARKFGGYAGLAQALLHHSVRPQDVFCELQGGAVPGTSCSIHSRLEWKPVEDCSEFQVQVLFRPVSAYAWEWACFGGAAGAALGALVLAAFFMVVGYFPALWGETVRVEASFWQRLLLLVGIVFVISGIFEDSCAAKIIGYLLVGLIGIQVGMEVGPWRLAEDVLMLGIVYVLAFGLLFGLGAAGLGALVGMKRGPQLPHIEV